MELFYCLARGGVRGPQYMWLYGYMVIWPIYIWLYGYMAIIMSRAGPCPRRCARLQPGTARLPPAKAGHNQILPYMVIWPKNISIIWWIALLAIALFQCSLEQRDCRQPRLGTSNDSVYGYMTKKDFNYLVNFTSADHIRCLALPPAKARHIE